MGGDQVYPIGERRRLREPYEGPVPGGAAGAAGRRAAADAVRAARQPRLVRRPDRVPAAVRPPQGRPHRRLAHRAARGRISRCELPADWWLLRDRRAVRGVHRRPAAGLLRARRPRRARARRPGDPHDAVAELGQGRRQPRRVRRDRLLHPHDPRSRPGRDVRVLLSGDLHHYARYTGPDRELITCGGGGAYLLPHPPAARADRRCRRGHADPQRQPAAAAVRPGRPLPGRGDVPAARAGACSAGCRCATPASPPCSASCRPCDAGDGRRGQPRRGTRPAAVQHPAGRSCWWSSWSATVLFAKPPNASAQAHARHWILGIAHGVAQIGPGRRRHLGLAATAVPRLAVAAGRWSWRRSSTGRSSGSWSPPSWWRSTC